MGYAVYEPNIDQVSFRVRVAERDIDAWLSLKDSLIERVSRFEYLGSTITENLDPDIEMKALYRSGKINDVSKNDISIL